MQGKLEHNTEFEVRPLQVNKSLFRKFWSYEEDAVLFRAFSKYGRRWKQVASLIPGRSENAIKNRFALLSQKYCSK